MDENNFTKILVEQLQPSFPEYELETRISIFYSLNFDEAGNIPINQNDKGDPVRGGGTGFEQDILLYERVSGQTSIVPRVAIEVKFGGVTTHDAIVYSEKAKRIRNVYPYLRYGFLIGDAPALPPRLLRLGTDFDFILRTSNPPLQNEKELLTVLLKEEIETSQKLGQIFFGQASVKLLHRKIIVEPGIESSIKTTKPMIHSEVTSLEKTFKIPNQKTYFIYENWVADNKAVIHFSDCRFCNNGQGIHPGAGTRNGRWHGPFSSFESAQKTAREKGRPVRTCRKCKPF